MREQAAAQEHSTLNTLKINHFYHYYAIVVLYRPLHVFFSRWCECAGPSRPPLHSTEWQPGPEPCKHIYAHLYNSTAEVSNLIVLNISREDCEDLLTRSRQESLQDGGRCEFK